MILNLINVQLHVISTCTRTTVQKLCVVKLERNKLGGYYIRGEMIQKKLFQFCLKKSISVSKKGRRI